MLPILLLFLLHQGGCTVDYPSDSLVPSNIGVTSRPYNEYKLTMDLNTTTVLLNTRMPSSGYLYAYNYYATSVVPFKVSIWRFIDFSNAWYWNGYDRVYDVFAVQNGSYELIHITDTIIPPAPVSSSWIYFTYPIKVSPNDVLGITYGTENPIPYSIGSSCTKLQGIREDCTLPFCFTPMPNPNNNFMFHQNGTYNFPTTDANCKMYSLNAKVQEYHQYAGCQMIQMQDNFYPYYIQSHSTYPDQSYSNYMSACWRLRAPNANTMLYVTSDTFDLESSSSCQYDALTITESPSNVRYGQYCGNYPLFVVYGGNEIIITFSTDASVVRSGFKLEIRSLDMTYFNQYQANPSMLWPWQDGTWTPSTANPVNTVPTDTTPAAGASTLALWSSLTLLEKIGLCIGAIVVAVILLAIIIAVVYYCCIRPSGKVKPTPQKTLPQSKGYNQTANGVSAYPRQNMVYTVPTGPPAHRLPPLSMHMPHTNRYPFQPSIQNHPYQIQRFLQEPNAPPTPRPAPKQPMAEQNPPLPRPTPKQPPSGPQYSSPPQHSLATVAFALKHPKPLKPIKAPFGGSQQQPSQPTDMTEEERYQHGRARLKWNAAQIPPPATYDEPIRNIKPQTVTKQPQGVTWQQQPTHQHHPDDWMYANQDHF